VGEQHFLLRLAEWVGGVLRKRETKPQTAPVTKERMIGAVNRF
jgi:hypothetical protein